MTKRTKKYFKIDLNNKKIAVNVFTHQYYMYEIGRYCCYFACQLRNLFENKHFFLAAN